MEQFNANCKLLTIWTFMNEKHKYTSAMLFKTSIHATTCESGQIYCHANPYYALMQQSSTQSQKLVLQSQLPFKWINNVKIIVAWTNILKLGDAKFYFILNDNFFLFKATHIAQYLHLSFLLIIWYFMPLKRIYPNLLHLVPNLLHKSTKMSSMYVSHDFQCHDSKQWPNQIETSLSLLPTKCTKGNSFHN